MIKSLWSAALAGLLLSAPVHAEGAFQIIGGMGDGNAVSGWNTGTQMASATIYAAPRAGQIEKKIIAFESTLAPGSILVRTHERKLYFILPGGQAAMYPIGVGRDGYTWSGSNSITRKAQWPDWRPPPNMIRREAARGHFIPAHMPGGPQNPLGARALYIGSTEYRIHGTTQPWSIGRAVSSGCIRMLNEHVIDLYDQVQVGARVVVE
jgi:lipoprotein-anchoring transpeptidase ErfK/SrfK